MPKHLRLEHRSAFADLLPARLAVARRIERIVSLQTRLRRRPVEMEQEHPSPLIRLDLRKLAGHGAFGRAGAGQGGRVLGARWTETEALAAVFAVSAVATPAGISGAVPLLPFQVCRCDAVSQGAGKLAARTIRLPRAGRGSLCSGVPAIRR